MEQNDLDLNKIANLSDDTQSDFSQKPQTNKFSKPFIAGILLIIAGILALISYGLIFLMDSSTVESLINMSQLPGENITATQIKNFLNICGTIGIIISVITLLGGLFSIQKKKWELTLVCALIGLFSLGPIIFLSSILSFIALILIIFAKNEFRRY